MDNILSALINYLEDCGSAKIASLLGYREGSTIRRWVKMGSIPEWQIEHLVKFLKIQGYLGDY